MSNSKLLVAILGGAAAAAALAYLFASEKGKGWRGEIGGAAGNISKKIMDKACELVDNMFESSGSASSKSKV